MKKLSLLCCALCICVSLAAQTPIKPTPIFKIRIVDTNADFRIRIVDAKAYVNIHPLHGGRKLDAYVARSGASRLADVSDINPRGFQEWEFVDQNEDFTVAFVDSAEHFTVKFVFDTVGLVNVAAKLAEIFARNAASTHIPGSLAASQYQASLLAQSSSAITDCKCKGIPLYGRVREVSSGADFDVRVVENFGDLKVEIVTIGPNKCGQWQFVDIGEDFTIKFVDIDEDFTIEYVTIAPGVSN